MDWSPIITASVTGLCAVFGQWIISRRKSKEEEARDAEREKNQNKRLDQLELIVGETQKIVESNQLQITELSKSLKDEQSARMIEHERLSEIKQELDENSLRTLRLDLLHAIESDPGNQLVILDLAQKYFVDMKGNCYMSKVFQEWADDHNVNITSIFNKG